MSDKNTFYSAHFDSIQALRGIAALLVVLEHIRFLNRGAFGVDIFFCISGFMIMLTTHRDGKAFFRKRLLRIIPFYYLMTLFTYGLLLLFPGMFEQTAARPVYLLKSLLFVPFDIGGGVLQPLVRIGWTINCEMFFYLLFGLSMRLTHRFRGLACSLTLCLIVALGAMLPSSWAPFVFYSDPIMLEFVFGILCFYIARFLYRKKEEGRLPEALGICCLLASAGLFFFLILTKPVINILDFRRPVLWGLPAMLIVLCFFTAGLFLRMPRFSVMLGNISFSLYLVHYYPILFIDRVLFDFSVFSPGALAAAIVSIMLVIAAACPAWYLIEKKITGWLRVRLLPRC